MFQDAPFNAFAFIQNVTLTMYVRVTMMINADKLRSLKKYNKYIAPMRSQAQRDVPTGWTRSNVNAIRLISKSTPPIRNPAPLNRRDSRCHVQVCLPSDVGNCDAHGIYCTCTCSPRSSCEPSWRSSRISFSCPASDCRTSSSKTARITG